MPGVRCPFVSFFFSVAQFSYLSCFFGGPGAEFKVLGSTGNVHRQANRKAARAKLLKTK